MKEVALITGASSGIGKELAIIHAQKGRDLVITARREVELNQLKHKLEQDYKIQVKVIVKDISLPNAPEEIYQEIKNNNINVKYLVNNAGFGGVRFFEEGDITDDIAMINVNIIALTKLTKFFITDFKKDNQGKILNISSVASLMPGPMQATYFATKAYVTSLSNALVQEVKSYNITISTIMPGPTKSEFAKVSKMDQNVLFKKAYSSKSVAKDGYRAMEQGKMNKLTGLPFWQKIGMKLLPFAPKKIVLQAVMLMQKPK